MDERLRTSTGFLGRWLTALGLCCALLATPVIAQAHDEPCLPVKASDFPVSPNSDPQKKIAVILVEFPGVPSPYTTSDVTAMLTTRQPGNPLSTFEIFTHSSRNQFQPALGVRSNGTPAIFGPYLVNRTAGERCTTRYTKWSDDARTIAASDGYKRKRFDHTVFVFPPRAKLSCSVTGIGEILGDTTWLFGLEVSSFVHELGHNLGLFHSGRRDQPGSLRQYGDVSSPMSAFQENTPVFSAANIAELSWFLRGEIETITRGSSANRNIFALERNTTASLRRAIRIPLKDGSVYIISYRQEFPSAPSSRSRAYVRGATIHRSFGAGRTTSLMATLADGAMFVDENNNVHITQNWHTSDTVALTLSSTAIPVGRTKGCFIVDPCTVSAERRTPSVTDCRGFSAQLFPSSFIAAPRCPTRESGEDFDQDGASDLVIPTADGDGDGIPNMEDCSPSSAASYRLYRYTDADSDGRYESIVGSGDGVCGSNRAPPYYLDESLSDTCPALADSDHTDNDRDGIGDLCQTSDTTATSRRRLLPSFQLLDRAGAKLQSLKAAKPVTIAVARATASAIRIFLASSIGESALSAPQQKTLRSIQKQLARKGNEKKAGAALRAAVAPSL